ncbi:MAG: hypothetical protein IT350_20885 [Deltaproteobacteria bacterium]|nr:hypothetical protein [Deltaproteobacteria bacterium]
MPRWSKTNKLFEEHLAASLSGRFKMRATGYRQSHDRDGRVWFEFDGREVADFSVEGFYAEVDRQVGIRDPDLSDWRMSRSDPQLRPRFFQMRDELTEKLRLDGVVVLADFVQDLTLYFQMNHAEILSSPSAVIRALGMLDRRLGKRSLRALTIGPEDPSPLVRRFLAIRYEAEGLRLNRDAPSFT